MVWALSSLWLSMRMQNDGCWPRNTLHKVVSLKKFNEHYCLVNSSLTEWHCWCPGRARFNVHEEAAYHDVPSIRKSYSAPGSETTTSQMSRGITVSPLTVIPYVCLSPLHFCFARHFSLLGKTNILYIQKATQCGRGRMVRVGSSALPWKGCMALSNDLKGLFCGLTPQLIHWFLHSLI